MTPVVTDPIDKFSIPWTANARPNTLLASQCFFKKYQTQKTKLTTAAASSGRVREMVRGSCIVARLARKDKADAEGDWPCLVKKKRRIGELALLAIQREDQSSAFPDTGKE